MDRLEEYIRRNREDLDRYNATKGLWKGIRKKLKKRNSTNRQWLSIAAMFVVILGTTLLLFRPVFRWSQGKCTQSSKKAKS